MLAYILPWLKQVETGETLLFYTTSYFYSSFSHFETVPWYLSPISQIQLPRTGPKHVFLLSFFAFKNEIGFPSLDNSSYQNSENSSDSPASCVGRPVLTDGSKDSIDGRGTNESVEVLLDSGSKKSASVDTFFGTANDSAAGGGSHGNISNSSSREGEGSDKTAETAASCGDHSGEGDGETSIQIICAVSSDETTNKAASGDGSCGTACGDASPKRASDNPLDKASSCVSPRGAACGESPKVSCSSLASTETSGDRPSGIESGGCPMRITPGEAGCFIVENNIGTLCVENGTGQVFSLDIDKNLS